MSSRADTAGSDDPFQNDDSIPLLTEVVPLRRPGVEPPTPAAGVLAPAASQASAPARGADARGAGLAAPERAAGDPDLPGAPAGGSSSAPRPDDASPAIQGGQGAHTGLSQADWDALAERIERGVTGRMLAQAGPMLENSLQTLVAPLIEQAAVQIAHDLHDVFSHLVQDLVARAVAEELALLQARDDEPAPPESH